jgi:glycine betaine/choline ABC-type transport system substrate-binding protein
VKGRSETRKRLYAVGGLFGFVAASAVLFKLVFALVDLGAGNRNNLVIVGSKADTEGMILGAAMAELIEHRTHLRVQLKSALGGTEICFHALSSDAIDVYPEYTGTALMAILDQPAERDPARVFSFVSREFARRYGLVWLPPLRFNNTYTLAMTAGRARALGIQRISDLARHPELRAGFTAEFMSRRDGYPGLEKRYGLHFSTAPRSMEAGLMYGAVSTGQVDVISAYATDGRIDKFGLVALEDDAHFFPPYQAAPLVRAETLARHPEIRAALAPLSGKVDDAEMRRLNAEVDVERRPIAEVADELVRRVTAR